MRSRMGPVDEGGGGQAAVWNGSGGRGWAEMQDVMDGILQPLEDVLVEAVGTGAGGRVLDVGCGAGGTTLAIARRLGTGGACTGIDISSAMVLGSRKSSRWSASATTMAARPSGVK